MSRAPRPAVATGLEVFLAERAGEMKGQRVGLLAHAASVDSSLRSTLRRLQGFSGIRLTALFGPEHGLLSGAQDMIAVSGERDAQSDLEVHSLYGATAESLSPSAASLERIDVLVVDLQDVGARYYTYAATAALALEALARCGKRMLVLDRPNPIGGGVEGPPLDEGMRSFVGHIRMPVRHGLTIGEMLRHHARGTEFEDALDIVPMQGWRRSMSFEETGLPWVPPSPNMPTLETAWVYPGLCLVEATNLSEGRGTTRPFEWIGAPFLDPEDLATALESEQLPGVVFRPLTFVPAFHKWAGQVCGGVAIHVTERERFRPVRTGTAVLMAARRLAPSQFAWRAEPYEFVVDRPAIDLLTGSSRMREGIEAGASLPDLIGCWRETESLWEQARLPSLLYS